MTQDALPPLTTAGRMFRIAWVGLILAAILGLFAYTAGLFSPHALSPAKIVDTFESLNGPHPGFRRNHAKGIGISGFFEGNGQGVALSKAAVFAKARTPVIGRFALAGGTPDQPDGPQVVRSMALLFKLPDGEEWRTGMNNIPVFPVRTVQGFQDLLIASAPDPTTHKPDPAKMKSFIASNPEAGPAFKILGAAPPTSGFADSAYNSLNAFRFVNAGGESTPVRWGMAPLEPIQSPTTQPTTQLSTQPAANKNYLFDALIAAVHRGPLQWKLVVTVGESTDSTSDPTIPWPPARQQIEVGTLTINAVEAEETSPARDINFDPLVLPAGIEGSDDPLLAARSAAYSPSFTRREGETKTPSAVTPAEVRP